MAMLCTNHYAFPVGEIISRFKKKGFKLIGLEMFQCLKELAEVLYKLNNKFFITNGFSSYTQEFLLA
ncbi:unnamed protein product [Brassica rapa]|uniref:Uncharacterized protein n=1 Tax=Brassica campestris TaxID=3711 RepID=A0A8D9HZ19_BRACM|nr:unnamed protein product [Brassica rapa]